MSALLEPVRLIDADFLHDPYPGYRALREAGPLHWSEEFFDGAWVLTRHADVEAALRDPRLSAQRTGGWVMEAAEGERAQLRPLQRLFARAMLFLDPPDHQRLRQLMQPAFRPDRLTALQSELDLMVAQLIDAVEDAPGAEFDFMERIARPLPARVIARLMGLEPEREADCMAWSEDLAAFIGAARPTPEQARTAQSSLIEMAAYFEQELLPRRRREPGDDIVSRLLEAERQGQIGAGAELLAQCAMLLFAGYETTRNLLGNGMLTLMRQRDQWQILCEQPERVPSAVRELLRYDSPVQWTGRRVAADFELHGQTLRRGELLIALIGSANRDPARHEQPERFDVRRANPGALSFGSGPHICIGAALTQIEAQTLLGALVRRCPDWTLAGSPRRNDNPVYRGLEVLPLRTQG